MRFLGFRVYDLVKVAIWRAIKLPKDIPLHFAFSFKMFFKLFHCAVFGSIFFPFKNDGCPTLSKYYATLFRGVPAGMVALNFLPLFCFTDNCEAETSKVHIVFTAQGAVVVSFFNLFL